MWNVLPALAVALVFGASLPPATGVMLPAVAAVAMCAVLLALAVVSRAPSVRVAAVVAAAIPAAAGLASWPTSTVPAPAADGLDALFVLDVIEGPRPAREGAPFDARVREVRMAGRAVRTDVRVVVRNALGETLPLAGDRVVVRGRWSTPDTARHPWAWDAARTARRSGHGGMVLARGELLFASTTPSVRRPLDAARMRTEALILQTLPDPQRGVVLAVLTGSRGDLDRDLRARFAATGAAHVLAVSGLHLGLVVLALRGVALGLARRVRWVTRRHGARRWAALVTLPAVVAYVVFTGAPASACRAGLMTGALLAADLAERRARGRQALALAVAVLVVVDPGQVTDVGFQLSVTATLGLVEMRRVTAVGLVGRFVASIRASTVASATTAPVLAWHFGSVPLASPITNLVVVPPIAFVSLPLAGLGAVLAPIWPAAAAWSLTAAGHAVQVGVVLQDLGGAPLAAGWHLGRPGGVGLLALTAAAALVTRAPWTPRIGLGVLVLVAVVALARPVTPTGWLVVQSIPVGHGDAFDVQGPDGRRWVIDGGTATAARRLVGPWLAAHGRTRVDAMIVTHADRDHAEGAAALVRQLRPRDVWVPDAARGRMMDRVDAAARAVGARVHRLGGGVCVSVGGAHGTFEAGATDDNDGGLVARVCHGAVCGLFTGDIEAPREVAMLQQGVPRVAWLKVAHHGSRTSSTPDFLDAARPQVALVPADRGTRVGAHPDVLARLRRRGVATWLTGDAPPPTLVTDGVRWWTCAVGAVPRVCGRAGWLSRR